MSQTWIAHARLLLICNNAQFVMKNNLPSQVGCHLLSRTRFPRVRTACHSFVSFCVPKSPTHQHHTQKHIAKHIALTRAHTLACTQARSHTRTHHICSTCRVLFSFTTHPKRVSGISLPKKNSFLLCGSSLPLQPTLSNHLFSYVPCIAKALCAWLAKAPQSCVRATPFTQLCIMNHARCVSLYTRASLDYSTAFPL